MRAISFYLFFFISISVFAQKQVAWLYLTPSVGYGTSFFYNKDTYYDDEILNSSFNSSFYGSLELGLNIKRHWELAFDVGYFNISQNYTALNVPSNIEILVKQQSIDYSAILRLKSGIGFNIGLGGVITSPFNVMLLSPNNSFNSLEITTHFKTYIPQLYFEPSFTFVSDVMYEIGFGVKMYYSLDNVLVDDFSLTSNNFIGRTVEYSDFELREFRAFGFFRFTYYFGMFVKNCRTQRYKLMRNYKRHRAPVF